MFCVPIEGPTNIFRNKTNICENTTSPESTLVKNHHRISYHSILEAVVSGIVRVSKEHTSTKLAEVFTNSMGAPRRGDLLDIFMY